MGAGAAFATIGLGVKTVEPNKPNKSRATCTLNDLNLNLGIRVILIALILKMGV